MARNVLKLPQTKAGRDHLRLCVKLANGWDFPDGTHATEIDWDVAIAAFNREWETDIAVWRRSRGE